MLTRDLALMNIAYCMMRTEIREMEKQWDRDRQDLFDKWTFDDPVLSISDAEYLESIQALNNQWRVKVEKHKRLAESLLSVLEYQAGDKEEEDK